MTYLWSLLVWNAAEGLIFGQDPIQAGTTAQIIIPQITELFDLYGTTVMLHQEDATPQLIKILKQKQAQYAIEVNPDDYGALFDELEKNKEKADVRESYLEGIERVLVRDWGVLGKPELPFDNMQSVSRVTMELVHGSERIFLHRHFLSSLPRASVYLIDMLRSQKELEKLPWLLNISYRTRNPQDLHNQAIENLLLFRQHAISLLNKDQSTTGTLVSKQALAARDPQYLLRILG